MPKCNNCILLYYNYHLFQILCYRGPPLDTLVHAQNTVIEDNLTRPVVLINEVWLFSSQTWWSGRDWPAFFLLDLHFWPRWFWHAMFQPTNEESGGKACLVWSFWSIVVVVVSCPSIHQVDTRGPPRFSTRHPLVDWTGRCDGHRRSVSTSTLLLQMVGGKCPAWEFQISNCIPPPRVGNKVSKIPSIEIDHSGIDKTTVTTKVHLYY